MQHHRHLIRSTIIDTHFRSIVIILDNMCVEKSTSIRENHGCRKHESGRLMTNVEARAYNGDLETEDPTGR